MVVLWLPTQLTISQDTVQKWIEQKLFEIKIGMFLDSFLQDFGLDYYIIAESFETTVPWDR